MNKEFYGLYLDSYFKKIFADTKDTILLKELSSIMLKEEKKYQRIW